MDLHNGFIYMPAYFDRQAQERLVRAIRLICHEAPFYTPSMPKNGKEMSVRMTNCGTFGWVSDKESGYRYQTYHPKTGRAWPPIPEQLLSLWREYSNYSGDPEACLINFYSEKSRMGLHQDKDEQNFDAPIISVSLGDSCLFRMGGSKRSDKTQSIRLHSGDIVIFSKNARLAFHGVDKIYPATSTLLKNTGRINLTLRRVTVL